MKVDKETLDKIAHLARLEFDERDSEKMIKDLGNIISFVEKLNEVNTDGVEPLTTMSHEVNALREDEVKPHLDHDIALKGAPRLTVVGTRGRQWRPAMRDADSAPLSLCTRAHSSPILVAPNPKQFGRKTWQ